MEITDRGEAARLAAHRASLAAWRGVPEADQFEAMGGIAAPSPGLLAMAGTFGRAMRDLVADGGRLAPRDVRKARRATCRACPNHDPSRDSCRVCGCGSVVPGGLAAKLAIASSGCPDEPPRWGPA